MEQYIRIAHDLCSKIKIALCNHKEYELAAQLREFEKKSTVNTMPEEKEFDKHPHNLAIKFADNRKLIGMERHWAYYAYLDGYDSGLEANTIGTEKELLAAGDLSKQWVEEAGDRKFSPSELGSDVDAHNYAKSRTNGELNDAYAKAYYGYKNGFEAGLKAKKEGYTISEEQIAELHSRLAGETGRSIVQEWFPDAEVFKPQRTYPVGQKIKLESKEDEYLIALVGFRACLINLTTGRQYNNSIKIEDEYYLSQYEIEELAEEPFTLIEPSNP